jgi:hypothetical protein
MEKLINKHGTIGPYDCEGNQVEMDWQWESEFDEAKITEMRFDGVRVELNNVAEWIVDALFQDIPYDELENQY